jgi:hypothetical protein
MPNDEIATTHQRLVEQVMSDERLLGLLPDDLSGVLLDWTIAHLDAAAATTTSTTDLQAQADLIRTQARRIATAAADAGDDRAALAARLNQAAPSIAQNAARSRVGAAGTGDSSLRSDGSSAGETSSVPNRIQEQPVEKAVVPGAATMPASDAAPFQRPLSGDAEPGVIQGKETATSVATNTMTKSPEQPIENSPSDSLRRTLKRLRSLFTWGGIR